MVLVILIFITSLVCLLISFVSLTLIVRHLHYQGRAFRETSNERAVIITGCDSGIGLELAKYFYKRTNFTIICGFLKPGLSHGHQELDHLQKTKHGRKHLVLTKLDLTNAQDVDDFVGLINQLQNDNKIRYLDSLINNAGVLIYGEFDWLTWDQIMSHVEVNLIGTLRLTRAVLPMIIESQGRIINVSSVNDLTVFPGLSIYSATKSALSTFSRGLGYELKKFGCHVINVRLGDFARLTNIMKNHAFQQNQMWQGMDQQKRDLYGDFFSQFNEHLLKNYGMTSPEKFESSSLFRDFENALLSRDPSASITCAPLGFRIFYSIMESIPIWLQYHLLDLMLRLGFRWKPPKLSSE